MRTPLADAADSRIRQALAPYPQMYDAEVVEIGAGANAGKVKVRLPGELAATADLPFAPVIGTVPALNARVLAMGDFASRRVISGAAAGGGGTSQAVGAFSAYLSADQLNITTATNTKIQYNTEDYDVSGWYDPTTNFRYTPLQAGYYRFNASAIFTPGVSGARVMLLLFKNGAEWSRLAMQHTASTQGITVAGGATAFANGTTDYFEIFLWHNFGVNTSDITGDPVGKFQGEFIGTA